MMDSRTSNRAMISVIETARGRKSTRFSMHLLSISLIAVFFIALMGGLAAGARMYRAAAKAQLAANELHLQSGLVTNIIRNNDVADAPRVDEGPEGPALVLTRTLASGAYETRLYHYQGQLLQEFTAAGRPYDPTTATVLLDTENFSFTVDGSLITITTDCGNFDVSLRSSLEPSVDAEEPSSHATQSGISTEGGTVS